MTAFARVSCLHGSVPPPDGDGRVGVRVFLTSGPAAVPSSGGVDPDGRAAPPGGRGGTRLADPQDQAPAAGVERRKVVGVVRHLAPVHGIADRARRAIALPRDLRADAPLRIPGEGEATLGARRLETLQPVEEEVELLLLGGVAGLGSAPGGGGLLQVVPEWGELPALREKGLPAVELGPAEVPGAEPAPDRGGGR